MSDIIKAAAAAACVTPEAVAGASRAHHLIAARWAAISIGHDAGMSHSRMARGLGDRDHTSIGHAIHCLRRETSTLPGRIEDALRIKELALKYLKEGLPIKEVKALETPPPDPRAVLPDAESVRRPARSGYVMEDGGIVCYPW
jgi:hypothetical protein